MAAKTKIQTVAAPFLATFVTVPSSTGVRATSIGLPCAEDFLAYTAVGAEPAGWIDTAAGGDEHRLAVGEPVR